MDKALPQIMRIELRGYRKRHRLTVVDVAGALGLHEHTIRRWEAGKTAPTTTELERWAAIVGLELRMELVDPKAAAEVAEPPTDERAAAQAEGVEGGDGV